MMGSFSQGMLLSASDGADTPSGLYLLEPFRVLSRVCVCTNRIPWEDPRSQAEGFFRLLKTFIFGK